MKVISLDLKIDNSGGIKVKNCKKIEKSVSQKKFIPSEYALEDIFLSKNDKAAASGLKYQK